jgi:hypothetical protein
MEPFTLVIWLMVGQRFEEVRMTGLSRAECRERLWTTEGDRTARGECIGAEGMTTKSLKLVPHICGFGWCLPVNGPGNAMLPARQPH